MGYIADILKYEGDNSTFIWKHPIEDFNSMTQLIVHELQEAIFFMNGQAMDLFGPGRYTLETGNIPKIGRFLDRQAGEKARQKDRRQKDHQGSPGRKGREKAWPQTQGCPGGPHGKGCKKARP